MELLQQTDHATLARWWCVLNGWGWPKELPGRESPDVPGHPRRNEIMREIAGIIGMKECLREWNKDTMTPERFEDWWEYRR